MENIIGEGAEAKIIKINENTLQKIRIQKTYRLKVIDEKLRKSRTKREFKILNKLYENNINVPKTFKINIDTYSFEFEYLKGIILKESLNENLKLDFLNTVFEQIIKMHNLDIVHLDLTTLNMIDINNKIFLIDFGLSQFSYKIEDKAVDLNLFFKCIKNEHPIYSGQIKLLEEEYEKKVNNGIKIIKRLKEIENRGRNKNKLIKNPNQ